MAPPNVLSLPEELLLIWHSHRLELLLSAGVLVACVRLAIHWRQTRRKAVLTPPLGTPMDEKVPIVTKNDLLEADHYTPVDFTTPIPRTVAKPGPKRVTGVRKTRATPRLPREDVNVSDITIQPLIFYFSLGGTTKGYAEQLLHLPSPHPSILPPILHDLTELDYDDFFISPPLPPTPNTLYFYTLLIPSYDISTDLDNFLDHLKETHHDFRIDTAPLSGLAGYAVFGFGDREGWPDEKEGFGKDAVAVDRWMARLTGGKRAFPLGVGDVSGDGDGEERLGEWREGVSGILKDLVEGRGLGEGVAGSGEALESGDEDDEGGEDIAGSAATRAKAGSRSRTGDLEDIKPSVPVDFTTTAVAKIKEMVPVNSPTYTSLTKQGYTIVGSQ